MLFALLTVAMIQAISFPEAPILQIFRNFDLTTLTCQDISCHRPFEKGILQVEATFRAERAYLFTFLEKYGSSNYAVCRLYPAKKFA